jgi:hypothetical protein
VEWHKCRIYTTADKGPLWVRLKPVERTSSNVAATTIT